MKKGKTGQVAFAALHVVCCGGLLLFATGLLTVGGVATWFGNGPTRAAGTAILAVAVIAVLARLLRRRSTQSSETVSGAPVNEPTTGHASRSH